MTDHIQTGLSGMAGNKGAVAIRIDFANTSICFVTAHLAAGFANYEERNHDYKTISDGLRFQHNRSIDDHETVIWLGDFNYRIGLGDEQARKLIEIGDLETLYENDQLKLQMGRGYAFPFYDESRITFNPTYKFDVGTDNYDTSEKQRIPAWCDRILRKGNNLRQTSYNSAPLRFSDHKPIYATFLCDVSIVDEKHKDELSTQLYSQRKAAVGKLTAGANVEDTEDEDLIGYDSIEPGLPPASSDKRKWWLDNGVPAQSTLRPPARGMTPNLSRPSNPFTPSDEPDWVRVDKESVAGQLPTRSRASPIPPRKLPPPHGSTQSLPQLPPRRVIPQNDGTGTPRSDSPASQMSALTLSTSAGSRKPAPPIPKKPTALSSPTSAKPPRNQLDDVKIAAKASTAPAAPPPRRSAASARLSKPPPEEDGARPQLPPRNVAAVKTPALMDAKDDDGMESLKDWEVLRPG